MSESSSRSSKAFPVWLIVLLYVVGLAVSVWGFLYLLDWSRALPPGADRLSIDKQFTIVNEKRRTALQIVGGLSLFVTAIFYFRTAKAAEQNAEAANVNARISQMRLDSERFVKATENLDSDKMSSRVGAIYSLERTARESAFDNKVVLEVIASFVFNSEHTAPPKTDKLLTRELYAGGLGCIKPDVQAALNVIGRLPIDSSSALVLNGSELHQAQFSSPPFKTRPDFSGVYFANSVVTCSLLASCDFKGTSFVGCDLRYSLLFHSCFDKTNFTNADLSHARCEDSTYHLADFTGAIIQGTFLPGVDLSTAKGLTQEQIDSALMSATTKLPDGLHLPKNLVEDKLARLG